MISYGSSFNKNAVDVIDLDGVLEDKKLPLSPWWMPCAEWRKLPRTSQATPPSCPSMTNDLSTSEDLIAKQLCQDISTRFLFPFNPFSLSHNYTNIVYTKLYLITVNQITQEHTNKSSQ